MSDHPDTEIRRLTADLAAAREETEVEIRRLQPGWRNWETIRNLAHAIDTEHRGSGPQMADDDLLPLVMRALQKFPGLVKERDAAVFNLAEARLRLALYEGPAWEGWDNGRPGLMTRRSGRHEVRVCIDDGVQEWRGYDCGGDTGYAHERWLTGHRCPTVTAAKVEAERWLAERAKEGGDAS